jgi:dipeptidyl aminopeptidase/acylaminoacyl peptidase
MIGGTPEEVPEEYACRSPLGGVDRISCPVLILHGEQDDVVPVVHARLLAGALEDLGKPCELGLLPEEGHSWSTPGLRTVWSRTVAYLERHLMAEP